MRSPAFSEILSAMQSNIVTVIWKLFWKKPAGSFANHAEKLDEIQVGRLFDRFYTVETASSGSTGLGLSIARALTEQMGGSITAEYKDGMILVHVHFP